MSKSTPLFSSIALIFLLAAQLSAQDFYGPSIQEIRLELPSKNWDVKFQRQ